MTIFVSELVNYCELLKITEMLDSNSNTSISSQVNKFLYRYRFLYGIGAKMCELLKPTWLGIEDNADAPNESYDIQAEQEQYLIDRIGLTLWGYLCELEAKNEKRQVG